MDYVGQDLFDSPAQTLVNAVNTVGVMGVTRDRQARPFSRSAVASAATWAQVEPLMARYLESLPIPVFVHTLPDRRAPG
jgi:hypothetical protein